MIRTHQVVLLRPARVLHVVRQLVVRAVRRRSLTHPVRRVVLGDLPVLGRVGRVALVLHQLGVRPEGDDALDGEVGVVRGAAHEVC